MKLKNWLIKNLGGVTPENHKTFTNHLLDIIEEGGNAVVLRHDYQSIGNATYDKPVIIAGDYVALHNCVLRTKKPGPALISAPLVRGTRLYCLTILDEDYARHENAGPFEIHECEMKAETGIDIRESVG